MTKFTTIETAAEAHQAAVEFHTETSEFVADWDDYRDEVLPLTDSELDDILSGEYA